MNTLEPTNDYPDTLLDRGLAELLGGETPPDLSERILATAQLTAAEPVTLAQGNTTMGTSTVKQSSRLRSWAMLAATIACVGTVIALLMPARNASRHPGNFENLAQVQSEKSESESAKEESLPLNSDGIDIGMGLKGLINDANAPKSSEELMMTVTPHIIIQDGEEERLGIAQGEGAGDLPALNIPHDDSGLWSQADSAAIKEKILRDKATAPSAGGAYGGRRSYAFDLSVPFRQNSFALEGEEASAPPVIYPDADQWEELTARRKMYGHVDLSQRSRPTLEDSSQTQVDNFFTVVPLDSPLSTAPEPSRDQYTPIHENPFITATGPDAVSTFSIDVDTASYANVRQFLQQSRRLPPPDAVRIEELVNYFDYDYTGPTDNTPFAANMEIAGCPWNPEHRLARIAIKGRDIDRHARPQSNLVFLIDVSGSMNEPNKLPLLVEGMKLFTRELGENDKVAIVVYASSEGLALNSTRGNEQETILAALDQLRAGGSTAGGAGINLAYQVATDNLIEGGTNRVILCTDGDFNVGVTDTDELTRLAELKAKTGVFLTVLGFGRGNLNDAMMEAISGKGNGNYHYVDNLTEARKVLVEEMVGTLITIAKDVKIQVEFNPAQVAGYRLIGYENRMLKTEDFNNDKKDAGEIGAGHTVTALYEIVPAGKEVGATGVDPLKYQQPIEYGAEGPGGYGGEYGGRGGYGGSAKPQAASNELLTLKLRYKLPDADKSTKLEFPITDRGGSFAEATKDFRFAAAVASFGMLLRNSEHQGETSFDAVSEIAHSALGDDPHGYRGEFLELVRLAKALTGEQPSTTAEPLRNEGP